MELSTICHCVCYWHAFLFLVPPSKPSCQFPSDHAITLGFSTEFRCYSAEGREVKLTFIEFDRKTADKGSCSVNKLRAEFAKA